MNLLARSDPPSSRDEKRVPLHVVAFCSLDTAAFADKAVPAFEKPLQDHLPIWFRLGTDIYLLDRPADSEAFDYEVWRDDSNDGGRGPREKMLEMAAGIEQLRESEGLIVISRIFEDTKAKMALRDEWRATVV